MEQQSNNQQVVIQQKESNGLGVAGFVISLVALLLSWIPVLNWILWLLGLIFSAIGICKRPRGLAIAGLVISLIGVIIIISIIGAVAGALATL